MRQPLFHRVGLLVFALTGWGVLAFADTVILSNGMRVEGTISKDKDGVVVIETSGGTVTLARSRIERIERAESSNPGCDLARSLEHQGRFLEAMEEYSKALGANPNDGEAKQGLDRCIRSFQQEYRKSNQALFEENDVDRLIERVEADVGRLPVNSPRRRAFGQIRSELYSRKGRELAERYDNAGAEKMLARAVETSPDSAEVMLEYAKLLARTEQWEKVRKILEPGAGRSGWPCECRLLLMEAFFELKDVDRAMAAYEYLYSGKDTGCGGPLLDQYRQKCAYFIGSAYKQRALALLQQGDRAQAMKLYKYGASLMQATAANLEQDVAFFKQIGDEKEQWAAEDRLDDARLREETEKQLRAAIASKASSASGPVADGGGGGKVTAGSLDSALSSARSRNRNVLLVFTASWCKYCKKLKREILPDSEVRSALGGYVLTELDGERGDGEKAKVRFGVSSYPTLIVLDSSGRELKRMEGCPQQPVDLASWLR